MGNGPSMEAPDPVSGCECNSYKAVEMSMEVDTASEISYLDNVQPLRVDAAVSEASVIDENGCKVVFVCNVTHKNNKSVEIDTNLDQIAEMIDSSQEVLLK